MIRNVNIMINVIIEWVILMGNHRARAPEHFFSDIGDRFDKSLEYDSEKSRKFNDKKGDLNAKT